MMKKLLLKGLPILALLFLSTGLLGQNYVFFEDWEAGLPVDWTVYDEDMAPVNDQITLDFPGGGLYTSGWVGPVGFVDADSNPIPGNWMVACSWFADPSIPSDDWLVSAPFTIESGGYELGWTGWATDGDYPDGYEVYLAEENSVEAFLATDPIAVVSAENGDPTARTFMLDESYTGQTLYAAFRHNSTDEFYLGLTDIYLLAPPDGNDAVLSGASPVEFGTINPNQTQPLSGLTASVYNNSIVPITGAQVTARIFAVDSVDVTVTTEVWSGVSDVQETISGIATVEVAIPGEFVPLVDGLYLLIYELTSDLGPADDDADNNFSSFFPFYVTAGEQARCLPEIGLIEELVPYTPDGYYVGSLGMDFDATGGTNIAQTDEFGSTFQVYEGGASLDSALVLVNGSAGSAYTTKVYAMNANGTVGAMIAESGSTTVPADGENWTYNNFGGVSLTEGVYLIAVVDPADGSTDPIFTNYYEPDVNSNYSASYLYQSATDNWINGVAINDPDVGSVTAIPAIYVSTSGAATFVDFVVDLNSFTADFDGFANGFVNEYSWDFGDGSTGTGQNVTHVFDGNGPYNVCLTGSLEDGSILGPVCQEVSPQCAVSANIQPTTSTLDVTVQNASDPVTIQWYAGDSATGTVVSTDASLTGLESGSTYTVVVTDGSGCTDTQTASTNSCAFTLEAPIIQETTSTVVWTNSLATGEAPFTFTWDPAIGAGSMDSGFADHPSGDWTMTVIDGNGCESSFMYFVPAVGIEELEGAIAATISPNPSAGVFQLDIDFNRSGELDFTVFTLAGQEVKNISAGNVNNFHQSVDLSDLQNGIYLMLVRFNGQSSMEKLVINK